MPGSVIDIISLNNGPMRSCYHCVRVQCAVCACVQYAKRICMCANVSANVSKFREFNFQGMVHSEIKTHSFTLSLSLSLFRDYSAGSTTQELRHGTDGGIHKKEEGF